MNIDSIIESLNIESELFNSILEILIPVLSAIFFSYICYIITKNLIAKILIKIVSRTKIAWDDYLINQKLFNRIGFLIIPTVFRSFLTDLDWTHLGMLMKILEIWMIFAVLSVLSTILSGVNRIYMNYSTSKNKPIKVFSQVIELFLYSAAIIVSIGIFTNKDTTSLLAGLTAFAAILMLIFKDSILGLVAGIQLSTNSMISIGDWISMPDCGADGNVVEINLITVKVQNFDKTITTIPTYKLISESFTNWRGMKESQGRRIKRYLYIDVNSIHYLTNEEISALKDSKLLGGYIQKMLKDLEEKNTDRKNSLDLYRMTNIGTFREYLNSWISSNPDINKKMTHMVRQLQPTPTGIPLEIYCFSMHQEWVKYEKVQSDIFDHVYAVLELFHLKAFQYSNNTVSGIS